MKQGIFRPTECIEKRFSRVAGKPSERAVRASQGRTMPKKGPRAI